MQKVEISVFEGNQELWNGVSKTPLEIGRQQEGDGGPLDLQDLVTSQRLVIAPVSARSIPRQALRVESSDDGQLRITNIHPRLSFYIGTQADPLAPGEVFTASDEIVVSLPENRTVRVTTCDPDGLVDREGLGAAATDLDAMTDAIGKLAADRELHRRVRATASDYFDRNHRLDPAMRAFENYFVDVLDVNSGDNDV